MAIAGVNSTAHPSGISGLNVVHTSGGGGYGTIPVSVPRTTPTPPAGTGSVSANQLTTQGQRFVSKAPPQTTGNSQPTCTTCSKVQSGIESATGMSSEIVLVAGAVLLVAFIWWAWG